jgi:hypothetical protein
MAVAKPFLLCPEGKGTLGFSLSSNFHLAARYALSASHFASSPPRRSNSHGTHQYKQKSTSGTPFSWLVPSRLRIRYRDTWDDPHHSFWKRYRRTMMDSKPTFILPKATKVALSKIIPEHPPTDADSGLIAKTDVCGALVSSPIEFSS